MPTLDIGTTWSSTFDMIWQMYSVRSVNDAVADRIPELRASAIYDTEWLTASKVRMFLQPAASITTKQSWSLYVSIGISCLAYKNVLQICERTLQSGDQTLVPIANGIYEKLLQYESAISSDPAILAKCLDPPLPFEIIEDSSSLCSVVTISKNDP